MNGTGRRILFPIDASENCERGFKWYIQYCHQKGDELILVHVLETRFTRGVNALDGDGTSTGLTADMVEGCRQGTEEARQIGERYARACRDAGVEYRLLALVGTKVGETIVRAAGDNVVDCVVIGFKGMGRTRRALLGSVSDYVLQNAGVPVLVVPPVSV